MQPPRALRTQESHTKNVDRLLARRFHTRPCVKERLNALTEQIIGAAIDVHRALGPGLLESAYERCLAFELARRGLRIEHQKAIPLVYNGVAVDCAYRADIVVEGEVIVEVKSVERLHSVHEAQMICYLRLADCCVGLIINFNVKVLARQGIQRIVNGFPE
jgi:GxxExxY protein